MPPSVDDSITVLVLPGGRVATLWDDALAVLCTLGAAAISRASHVEGRVSQHYGILWEADMRPIGGQIIGPFFTRDDALDAERKFLATEHGLALIERAANEPPEACRLDRSAVTAASAATATPPGGACLENAESPCS